MGTISRKPALRVRAAARPASPASFQRPSVDHRMQAAESMRNIDSLYTACQKKAVGKIEMYRQVR